MIAVALPGLRMLRSMLHESTFAPEARLGEEARVDGRGKLNHAPFRTPECGVLLLYRAFCFLAEGSDEEGRHNFTLAAMDATVATGK